MLVRFRHGHIDSPHWESISLHASRAGLGGVHCIPNAACRIQSGSPVTTQSTCERSRWLWRRRYANESTSIAMEILES